MSVTEYNLGKHCGITFAGIKPASLITIKKENIKNISYFSKKFRVKGFVFKHMKSFNGKAIYYVYHKGMLEKTLSNFENRAFLEERGYSWKTISQAISILKKKMNEDDFPHEIGVFLGYALDDVKGYISEPTAKTELCDYWKVYFNMGEKKKIFEKFRRCADWIHQKMNEGQSIVEIFQV